MSKLIVETEMNGIPDCCGLCDPLLAAVCAMKHDQTIDEMMLRCGRPPWCPIKGVLPDKHGRLVDADAMAKDLEYDCELDARGLDDMTIVGHEREHLQFDKDCKQNCIWYLTEQETIVQAERSEHEQID